MEKENICICLSFLYFHLGVLMERILDKRSRVSGLLTPDFVRWKKK